MRRDFQVRQWTVEQGLPDDRIHCLLQARDGYIWIGTRNGLVRFDGRRFSLYDRANTPAFEVNDIMGLAEDVDGTLWINGRGNSCILLSDGEFRKAVTADGQPLTGYGVTASPRGGVWCALTPSMTLTRWQGGVATETIPLQVAVHFSIAETVSGELWMVEPGHLSFRAVPTAPLREFPIAKPASAYDIGHGLAKNGNGIWLFYSDLQHGARLDRLDISGPKTTVSGLPGIDLRSQFLVPARDGSFWIPLNELGLQHLQGTNRIRYQFPWNRAREYALCAMEDREGNLWVGTEYSGLFHLKRRSMQLFGVDAGLPHENVRSVLTNRTGGIWAGTDAGLAVLNPGASRLNNQASRPGMHAEGAVGSFPPPGDSEFSVRALAEGENGGLWVGTSRGLYHLRDGRYHAQPLPVVNHDTLDLQSLASLKLRGLWRGRSDRLWIATPNVASVLSSGEPFSRPLNAFLFSARHDCILEDRAGNIWMAAEDAGVGFVHRDDVALFFADPPRFTATNLVYGGLYELSKRAGHAHVKWFSTTNGFPSRQAWDLYEARDGAIWSATEGGVVRFTGAGNMSGLTFFNFTKAHGLAEHIVNSIIEDDVGFLWFGTDHGVFRVRHDELLAVAGGKADRVGSTTYGGPDGVSDFETNGRISHPGVCKSPDGRLWFATTKGVAVFDPARLQHDVDSPPLASIEEVLADGELISAHARSGDYVGSAEAPVKVARGDASRPVSGVATSRVHRRLAPGRGRILEFRFNGLNFSAPELCRFRFRLEGYDAPGIWHDSDVRRIAQYTNLDPGGYQFEVMAADRQGLWSAKPARFAFTLVPYFRQTWLFKTGTVSAAALTLFLLVRGIERRKATVRREKEREHLRADLHDVLGSKLGEIQLALQTSGTRSSPDHDRLAESVRGASAALRDILFVTKPDSALFSDLVLRIESQAARLISPTAANVSLQTDIPEFSLSPEMTHALLFAANEALQNIAKHSAAKNVVISARLASASSAELSIVDDGAGFVPEMTASDRAGEHLGLGIMRQRIKSAGGNCLIQSGPGKGTRVIFQIPRS